VSRISAIIVLYNALEEVRACLASLPASREEGLEVIVVDNASPQGGVGALAKEFPGIRLVENRRNLGFARAVNQAADLARGDFLLLLNPDTTFLPGNDAPRIMAAWLAQRPRAGAAGPRLLNPDGSLQTSAYRFPTLLQTAAHLLGLKRLIPTEVIRSRGPAWLGRWFGQFDRHDSARPVDYCTGAALMIKRSVWEKIGGLDERFFLYYEEKDFCLQLHRAGYQVWLLPQARIGHRIGASSETLPEVARLARYESMLAYFAKNEYGKLPILKAMLLQAAAVRHARAALAGRREEAATWRKVARLAWEAE